MGKEFHCHRYASVSGGKECPKCLVLRNYFKPMQNVLLALILTFDLATAATAQSAPAPNLELRLRPGALVDGVPDAFTFEIVIWLRYEFKPLRSNAKSGNGFGCAADKVNWPSILERAHEWRLLRPGESVSQTLPQAKLHYESREPGTYDFWADYTPPTVGPEDQQALRNTGIDFCSGAAIHTSPNFHEAAMSEMAIKPSSRTLADPDRFEFNRQQIANELMSTDNFRYADFSLAIFITYRIR